MRRRITLHVGTPKSGTTYLQTVMRARRPELSVASWLYPGEAYLPERGLNHQYPVYGLQPARVDWKDTSHPNFRNALTRMLDEVKAHPTSALISAEAMSALEPREIKNFLDLLELDPDDTRVVVTARDYGRLIASSWQQDIKAGSVNHLSPFLATIAGGRQSPESHYWNTFSPPRLLRRWAETVGWTNVHLVTVPQGGHPPARLLERFLHAAGMPTIAEPAEQVPNQQANTSLTWPQAEFIRAMNAVLLQEGYSADRRVAAREYLYQRLTARPPASRHHITLPPQIRESIEAWSAEDIAELAALPVSIVGSLDDLRPQWGADAPRADVWTLEMARCVLPLIPDPQVQVKAPASPPPPLLQRVARKLRGVLRPRR